MLTKLLEALDPYAALVRVGVLLAAWLAVWIWHTEAVNKADTAGYNRAVNEQRGVQLQELKDALKREDVYKRREKEADDERTRLQGLQSQAADLAAASNLRLRDTTRKYVAAMHAASANCPALRLSGDTLGAVLDECRERYRAVGRTADGWYADWKYCHDKWPQ